MCNSSTAASAADSPSSLMEALARFNFSPPPHEPGSHSTPSSTTSPSYKVDCESASPPPIATSTQHATLVHEKNKCVDSPCRSGQRSNASFVDGGATIFKRSLHVTCPDCGQRMKDFRLLRHQANSCPERRFGRDHRCYCGRRYVRLGAVKRHHKQSPRCLEMADSSSVSSASESEAGRFVPVSGQQSVSQAMSVPPTTPHGVFPATLFHGQSTWMRVLADDQLASVLNLSAMRNRKISGVCLQDQAGNEYIVQPIYSNSHCSSCNRNMNAAATLFCNRKRYPADPPTHYGASCAVPAFPETETIRGVTGPPCTRTFNATPLTPSQCQIATVSQGLNSNQGVIQGDSSFQAAFGASSLFCHEESSRYIPTTTQEAVQTVSLGGLQEHARSAQTHDGNPSGHLFGEQYTQMQVDRSSGLNHLVQAADAAMSSGHLSGGPYVPAQANVDSSNHQNPSSGSRTDPSPLVPFNTPDSECSADCLRQEIQGEYVNVGGEGESPVDLSDLSPFIDLVEIP